MTVGLVALVVALVAVAWRSRRGPGVAPGRAAHGQGHRRHHVATPDVLDALDVAVAVVAADGRFVSCNRAWRERCAQYGIPAAALAPGAPVAGFFLAVTKGDHERAEYGIGGVTAVATGFTASFEAGIRFPGGAGAERHRLRASALRRGGAVLHLADVTAAAVADRLAHRVSHDALTRLPNRVLFDDRLGHALAAAGRSHRWVAVLYCDLDGFKAVNDAHGHVVGDRLLVAVAARLRAALRPGDTLARLGGDEFAVVCDAVAGPDDARAIAQRLVEAVAVPVPVAGVEARVGLSVGVALGCRGDDPVDVVRRADAAMYRAKRAGRGCVRLDHLVGRREASPA